MATGSKLVIVESPTKARKIGGYLGDGYTVMASVGHIRDLAQPSQIPAADKARYGRFGVDVNDGFAPYYIVDNDKKRTVAELKSALKNADELYLATDEDREGEAIAWHLVQTLKPKVPVKRMVFNAYFHVTRQIQSFVVTMCVMFLLRGVCAFLTTESPVYAAGYVTGFNNMPFLMAITIVVLVITFVVTRFTSLGHNLKAIGANEKAARFAGIEVQKTKYAIYIIAGCITGFAAFVNAIKVGSVTSTAGNMFETQLLIAMVLGGMPINGGARARFSNVVIGVLSYLVLQKGLVMMGFTTEIQQLILGVVFIIMVALFSDRSSNQVIK